MRNVGEETILQRLINSRVPVTNRLSSSPLTACRSVVHVINGHTLRSSDLKDANPIKFYEYRDFFTAYFIGFMSHQFGIIDVFTKGHLAKVIRSMIDKNPRMNTNSYVVKVIEQHDSRKVITRLDDSREEQNSIALG